LLGLAFAGNIGGMLTPIASPQNAIALGVFNNYVEGLAEEGVGQQVCLFEKERLC
jgi:phosphate transporter